MDGVKDLLLNVLLIIVPVYLYQSLCLDRAERLPIRNRRLIFLLGAVSILLCMTFPVYIMPGYIYDLRLVPLLMASLYGGYRVGLLLFAMLAVYRYFLGGHGFTVMMITYPVFLAVAFYFFSRFRSYTRKLRTWIAVLLAFGSSALVNLVVIATTGPQPPERLVFYLEFSLIHALAMWIAVFVTENMREKTRMRHKIEQTEKLHLLGELAASVTHEIRNPMTVVRGFLQLLLNNQIDEDKKQMFLRLGIEELDRSESIISTYLSFARPQAKQMMAVDIGDRITHATAIIYSYAILRNVEIKQETADGLLIMADPEKISQVLINLLKNGIEAMPDGGTLQIRAFRKADLVTIIVQDCGMGMTQEQASRLGKAFFSTKDTGTGLGLSVSYQIVESFNGQIHVNSERNRGTQFTITLPALSA